MRLSELYSGQKGIILNIKGSGALRRRLTEMGFVRGVEILVIKNAPLKDPIEYKIMGYEVSLRRSEAANIEVEPLDENERHARYHERKGEVPRRLTTRLDRHRAREHGAFNDEILDHIEEHVNRRFAEDPHPHSDPLHNEDSTSRPKDSHDEHSSHCHHEELYNQKFHRKYRGHAGRHRRDEENRAEVEQFDSSKKPHSKRPKRPVIRVALVGNPNSGKTTLFNFISGLNEHTGNYSGVTVDVKLARFRHEGYILEVADLPGTYSLSAFSPEEKLVRDYIINEKPDLVVNVVDSTNLERNLYLTTQLLELERPMIIALNMYDEFQSSGDRLNVTKLSQLFATPIIPTVSRQGRGVAQLLDKIVSYRPKEVRSVNYLPEVELLLEKIEEDIEKLNKTHYPSRYAAVKMVEGNEEVVEVWQETRDYIEQERPKIESLYNEDTETLMAESRYGFVRGALKETHTPTEALRENRSMRIDRVLTHKYWGLPIFLVILWMIFYATFMLGEYPMEWIEAGVGWIKGAVSGWMSDGALRSLIVDGVIDGVGSVIVFLPNIVILFLFISLMEDTGYMARVAFITDKLMHKVGLHGKSFIPLIIGFGCNVPAIMATRTIENRENRLQTMLIIPLMSCSARLPVYILIIGAFFPDNAANMLFFIYMVGVMLAIGSALLFKKTLFRGREAHFVMEIPPYRIPTAIGVIKHMWNKAGVYLKKMGGIILVAVIIIWALGYYPNQGDKSEGSSYLESIGKSIEPVLRPIGLDWKAGIGLMAGVAAKEVVVSTMGVIYDTQEGTLGETLQSELDEEGNPVWTTAVALSFLAFVLIYFPCAAVLAAIRREAGAWKWAIFMVLYTTGLAWTVSFIVYRIALLAIGS